jgi:hypothetical protein
MMGKPLPSVARSRRITLLLGSSTGAPLRPPVSSAWRMPCTALRPMVVLVATTPSMPWRMQGGGDHGDLVFVQVGSDFHEQGHAALRAVGAGVLLCQLLAALGNRFQQAVERCVALQRAQVLGVGGADVDGDVVGMRVHAVQAGEVIARGVLDGRGGVLADVQAQQHGVLLLAAELGLLHIVQKGVQPVVVEAQAVDECACLGQAEHAWLGVAGLPFGRDGAHLDKAKAHGTQRVDAARVLVQPGGQAHAVGKAQACQLDGVVYRFVAPGPLQRRALATREHVHGQVVGGFGVQAEQKGAGEGVGDQ